MEQGLRVNVQMYQIIDRIYVCYINVRILINADYYMIKTPKWYTRLSMCGYGTCRFMKLRAFMSRVRIIPHDVAIDNQWLTKCINRKCQDYVYIK